MTCTSRCILTCISGLINISVYFILRNGVGHRKSVAIAPGAHRYGSMLYSYRLQILTSSI